jgi:hypothetical protein
VTAAIARIAPKLTKENPMVDRPDADRSESVPADHSVEGAPPTLGPCRDLVGGASDVVARFRANDPITTAGLAADANCKVENDVSDFEVQLKKGMVKADCLARVMFGRSTSNLPGEMHEPGDVAERLRQEIIRQDFVDE